MLLITGAAGYIGSHTCLALLRAGYEIVGIDNYCNSSEESVRRVRELAGKDFACIRCDIRDIDELRKVFAEYRPTGVVHFAGLKAVGESARIPLEYYENNIGGTLNLCRVMAEYDCFQMVFSSSATVYGLAEPPFTEEMRTGDCSNPYGRTKYMIEEILKDLAASDSRWSIAMLRYFNPIGADESGRIGEDPEGIPNNLMPYITQVAVGKLPELGVFGNDYDTPDGTGVRDYIHVSDLADGHVKAVEYVRDHPGAQAINLGTGSGVSVLELIHAFEQASGKKVPYKILPRRPGDVARSFADPSKAGRLLNFRTKRDVAKMCEDAWRWQSNNPTGYSG